MVKESRKTLLTYSLEPQPRLLFFASLIIANPNKLIIRLGNKVQNGQRLQVEAQRKQGG